MITDKLMREIHANAVNKGFWDEGKDIPRSLALIHSEVSEALEADRNNDWPNFKEELADIVIRVIDLCVALEIDITEEIEVKHTKNLKRPKMHGGKRY